MLPKAFFNPNPATTEISKFLAGENTIAAFENYKIKKESKLPEVISNYLKSIISATHDGSHRGKIDAHINELKTPYLFKSLLFQLLDILVWFKEHVDQNPITKNWFNSNDENQAIDEKKWIEGKVINYNSVKGYAFFNSSNIEENVFIAPHLVSENELSPGQKIKGTIDEYYCNRSNELKTRFINIKKL